MFYGHLEYFIDIWDILAPFGTSCVHLVHFSGFGILCQEKSGNPIRNVCLPQLHTYDVNITYATFILPLFRTCNMYV
jgi:hypothetical protein